MAIEVPCDYCSRYTWLDEEPEPEDDIICANCEEQRDDARWGCRGGKAMGREDRPMSRPRRTEFELEMDLWCGAPPMPSNETEGDRKEAYAAHFERDVLNAAEYLGWEVVNSIIDDAKGKA